MATERRATIHVLERGDLFFLYRPNRDQYEPGGLLDIRRFYMVLYPQGQERFRLIAIGKKKLPGFDDGGQRHWGFVDGVFRTAEELRQAAAGIPLLRKSRWGIGGEAQQNPRTPMLDGV